MSSGSRRPPPLTTPLTLEEQLIDARVPTQLGRAFAELGTSSVSAADPEPAWRRLLTGTSIERICRFKYGRTVARDGTVRAGAVILRLPARENGRSRAGQRVELHVRLDGRLVVWDGERELLSTPAPLEAVQPQALGHARVETGTRIPSAASAHDPAVAGPPLAPGRAGHEARL